MLNLSRFRQRRLAAIGFALTTAVGVLILPSSPSGANPIYSPTPDPGTVPIKGTVNTIQHITVNAARSDNMATRHRPDRLRPVGLQPPRGHHWRKGRRRFHGAEQRPDLRRVSRLRNASQQPNGGHSCLWPERVGRAVRVAGGHPRKHRPRRLLSHHRRRLRHRPGPIHDSRHRPTGNLFRDSPGGRPNGGVIFKTSWQMVLNQPAPTTLTLSASPNPATFGSPVTFTGTLSGGLGQPQ